MKNYSSHEDLGDNILEHMDSLEILGFSYIVYQDTLLCKNADQNDSIFRTLKINDKYVFCEECFGYLPRRNSSSPNDQFPICNKNDFHALTKVARKLFELAEEVQLVV